MTVYTRVGRSHVPLSVLLLLSPFMLIYLVLAALWLTVVFSWKALVWFVGGIAWACDRLSSPQGVDSVGDDVTG